MSDDRVMMWVEERNRGAKFQAPRRLISGDVDGEVKGRRSL